MEPNIKGLGKKLDNTADDGRVETKAKQTSRNNKRLWAVQVFMVQLHGRALQQTTNLNSKETTMLKKQEITQLNGYAKALEDQDGMTDVEFQVAFGVSKKKAKNNIALLIRTFVENRRPS